jgi:hypothetical protein
METLSCEYKASTPNRRKGDLVRLEGGSVSFLIMLYSYPSAWRCYVYIAPTEERYEIISLVCFLNSSLTLEQR